MSKPNDNDKPRKPYHEPKLENAGSLASITKLFSGGSRSDRFARAGGRFKWPFRR